MNGQCLCGETTFEVELKIMMYMLAIARCVVDKPVVSL